MNHNLLFAALFASSVLVGCGSGDIEIAPSTLVNNSNNTNNSGGGGGNDDDVCASYVNSGGQTIQGSYDGTDCFYSQSFVGAGNNLKFDLTIPALPNGGAHIFQGSLFVGEAFDSDAEMQAAGIAEGGDGPVLTIEAGATLAWQTSKDFMIINRGSQIFAVGTPDAPITLTSSSDVDGSVGPEDVQQWGGVVINGFGVTNKCAYTGTRGEEGFALAGECHVAAEGAAGLDESFYGGADDSDSSGRFEFVRVKHTGATVGNGDELNGITFGAVGSSTVVSNLEVYSTYDDGIEMFGGRFDIDNFVALYVRDDSLDLDEGWIGTINNALLIQSETDGNQCIESDGIGSFSDLDGATVEDFIARGLNTRVTINNLTCIFSPNGSDTATHDPGAGLRFREGIFVTLNDSMIIGSFAANNGVSGTDNFCLRIDDRSAQAALDGDLTLNNVIYACAEKTSGQSLAGSGTTEEQFALDSGNIFATIPGGTAVSATTANDAELQLLEGAPAIYSINYATSQVDGAVPGAGSDPTPASFLGALSLGDTDWTAGWTFGLHPDNQAQPLWFEAL
ncbi:MAG TPA: hypothetical protein VFZ51_01990 [Woeseiaceae bacterium]